MTKRILLVFMGAVAAGVIASAGAPSNLSPDLPPNVLSDASSSPSAVSDTDRKATMDQVVALQKVVIGYGDELRQAAGGAPPNPTTVRIGPAPCPGKHTDFAEGGVFYVAGGWQINLAPSRQVSTIRDIRDAWRARGFRIERYDEWDGTRAVVEMEDARNGFALSVASTLPPTAVAIRVVSSCVRPVDGQFPGDSLSIYQ